MLPILAVLLLAPITPLQTEPGAKPESFLALWDRADGFIRSMYYARNVKRDEMERLLNEHAPRARAAKDRDEFGRVMHELTKKFGDSHFAFLPDSEQGFYSFDALAQGDKARSMPHIGAWFKREGDAFTVQMVLEGMAAEKAGLRKGDVVRTVDGRPFSPIDALADKVDREVTVTYERGGQTREATVRVTSQPALAMFLEATRNSARIIERDGKRYGYVHLWTMAGDAFRTYLHGRIRAYQNTDGFILDLRSGFGRRPEGYADPFFRPDIELEWRSPGGGGSKERYGYAKPLVVLTDGGSRSAKEVLAAILKKSGRATLVGSRTAGDVLGTTPLRLADWCYLEIPLVEVYVSGDRLEGVGVEPDVPVPVERGPEDRDEYLETALAVLGSKSK